MRAPYWKAAGFSLALTTPLLTPIGVAIDFDGLCPLLFFIVLPLIGRALGPDRTAVAPAPRYQRLWVGYLMLLPYGYLPVWFAVLLWSADTVSKATTAIDTALAITVGLAISSAVSTCIAHEVMHRSGIINRTIARVMVIVCGYPHLIEEHRFHHAHVGDAAIGSTPRRGEAVYPFVIRSARQGWRNALWLERQRLRRCRQGRWRHRIRQNVLLTLLLAMALAWQWGSSALMLFLAQALFSLFAVQMITYIQHYGLVRRPGQRPGPELSWADNCVIANVLTFNINHHSHHHLAPRLPYYQLCTHPDAPRLPASYMLLFLVALLPPLWRLLIDRRLDRYHNRYRLPAVPYADA